MSAFDIINVPDDTLDRLFIGRATEGDQLLAHNALLKLKGGEQEAVDEQRARELLAAEYERGGLSPEAERIRKAFMEHPTSPTARAIRAITAALRSKQPAASEGDQS